MPTYYFNIRCDDFFASDPNGEILTGPECLRAEAIQAARNLIAEYKKYGSNISDLQFEIVNEQGELLEVVLFSEALLN